MYTGRQLIGELDDASSDLSREADSIRSKIKGYRAQADRLADECRENLRKIADIIIREGVGLPADIKRMLAQREQRNSEMQSKLSTLLSELPDHESKAKKTKTEFDTINGRLKSSIRNSEAEFYARPDIVELQALREASEKALDQISHRLDRARRDLEENAKDYRADPLFMYLSDRRYLTGDYKGKGFIRTLDAWLARITHFADNIGNYEKLHQIPGWVEDRWNEQKTVVSGHDSRHEDLLAAAMAHLDDLKAQTKSAMQEFQAADGLMKSIKSEIRAIEATLESAEKDEDEAMDRIVNVFTGKLNDASSRELSTAVSRTKTTEDDRLFSQIQANRSDISKLHRQVSDLNSEVRRIEERADEIDSVISRIRRNDWDDSEHKFDVSARSITDDLTRGSVTAFAISSMLESNHIAPPPVVVESYSSSSWNDDDSSSSWGSSSSFGSSSSSWSSSDSISNDSSDDWKTDDSF